MSLTPTTQPQEPAWGQADIASVLPELLQMQEPRMSSPFH